MLSPLVNSVLAGTILVNTLYLPRPLPCWAAYSLLAVTQSPGLIVFDLTSFGTLFAFILVCGGIWIMRKRHPEIPRPFKTPLVPLVPILGILVCSFMIIALDIFTLASAGVWMILGLIVYFSYSKKRSNLNN